MTEADRDRQAYGLAEQYLLGLGVPGVTPELLAYYQRPPVNRLRPSDLAGIYQRLLESAQNRNMASTVIGRSIGGVENLSRVTFGFNPIQVLQRYRRSDEFLSEIITALHPRGKVRRTPRGLWPLFCNSALSAARFLADFGTAQEFYAWVDTFHDDDRKLPALPLLLSKEIAGFGFALACDFLKELGYFKLAKPDVHVGALIRGLLLSDPKADDYAVYKAVLRIARHQGTTAYDVDKTFWLVGSGFFYDHGDIGRNGHVRTDRAGFIQKARRQLDQAAGQQSDPVSHSTTITGPPGARESSEAEPARRNAQRAPITPPLSLTFDVVYRFILEQPGAKSPELRTTGGVPFVAQAKRARTGRRFICLPHNNRIYEQDWGYMTNHMGKEGQRIGQYSVPLDEWASRV